MLPKPLVSVKGGLKVTKMTTNFLTRSKPEIIFELLKVGKRLLIFWLVQGQ